MIDRFRGKLSSGVLRPNECGRHAAALDVTGALYVSASGFRGTIPSFAGLRFSAMEVEWRN
jgi:hypothetical protein